MDPKGFSDFIAKHGQIVGVETVKGKTEFDDDSYIYKFADGAKVRYTPEVRDKSGNVIQGAKFEPDESVPVADARNKTTARPPNGKPMEIIDTPAGKQWAAFNPETGAYDKLLGPVEQGAKYGPAVPDGKGGMVQPEMDPATGQIKGFVPVQGAPPTGSQPTTARGKTRKEIEPGIFEVTTASKRSADGETVEEGAVYYEDAQGNPVPKPQKAQPKQTQLVTIRGEQYEAVTDPATGDTIYRKPQLPESERSPIPTSRDLGQVRAQLGEIIPAAIAERDKLTEIFNRGGMSQADYEKQALRIMSDANSRYTELQGLLSAQNTITGQQERQRGQTISQANNATQFANSALERTMKLVTNPPAGIYGPNAGEVAVRGIQGLLNMQNEYLKGVPGFSVPGDVPLTPFQKNILTIDPTGAIKIETGAGSGATGGGSDISNIGSMLSNGLPGAGVGPQGENLTRPGFSEGQESPYQSLLQEYADPDDQDWSSAMSRVMQESGIA